jgi:hypothetical protein
MWKRAGWLSREVVSASELRRIRRSLEEFDSLDAVDDEMR